MNDTLRKEVYEKIKEIRDNYSEPDDNRNLLIVQCYSLIASHTYARVECIIREQDFYLPAQSINIFTAVYLNGDTKEHRYELLIDDDVFTDAVEEDIDDFIDRVLDYEKEAEGMFLGLSFKSKP